jgi:hypothetical protein
VSLRHGDVACAGAGGAYGPDMQKAIVAVAERINKSGGIHGRPVQIFPRGQPDQPRGGGARGRQAPRRQPRGRPHVDVRHGGHIARTQPNTKLQGKVYAKWVLSRKEWKRVAYMALQTPFAVPFGDNFMGTVEGSRFAKNLFPFLTGVRLAAAQQMLVGVLLVALMIRRPEGLLPER